MKARKPARTGKCSSEDADKNIRERGNAKAGKSKKTQKREGPARIGKRGSEKAGKNKKP